MSVGIYWFQFKMSVGIYFSGLYVKIYKIKSGLGQRGGDICFPLKTPSSLTCVRSSFSPGPHHVSLVRQINHYEGHIQKKLTSNEFNV